MESEKNKEEIKKKRKPKGFRKGYKGILTVSFDIYIVKLLNKVHSNISIKSETIATINNMIRIITEKIMKCVNLLMTLSNKKTISIMEIQTVVMLIFPGELKNYTSDATKAVTKFVETIKERENEKKSGKKIEKMSRSSMAKLILPVSRVENIMKQLSTSDRKGASTAIYFTSILESITFAILDLAGNVTIDFKRKRMRVRDVTLAVKNSEELDLLFKNVIFGGGVVPYIEEKLLSKKKKEEE